MSYVRDLAVHGLVTANLNGHVSTVLTHVRGQMLAHLGDGELLDPRAGLQTIFRRCVKRRNLPRRVVRYYRSVCAGLAGSLEGRALERDDELQGLRGSANVHAVPVQPERIASFITLSYEPMFTWRLDGVIEFWNSGAARLYGFTAEQAIGRSSHELLQTKFPVEFSALRSQLLNENFWYGELCHVCKNHTQVIVESRMQLLQDGSVLEVNRDITARRQVEIALHESEERLRWLASIVESSDDAIVSKNLDGIITSWNAGAERVFGYSAGEAVGQPITIVIPQDRRHEEPEILARIRRGGRVDHFETVRRRKDGELIAVSLTISPIRNVKGEIVGASKIARDVTEQKRNQERIATLAREAEHRSKNMLANVQAVVNLSTADTLNGLKKAIEGRINALANVHSLFVETRWIGAELSAIAKQELSPYAATSESRVEINGPPVLLSPDTAQAVAICLHELATNAVKYGALSVATGRLDLTWSHEADGTLILRWMETGSPNVKAPTRRGFGARVIEQMIAQLNGKVGFDWRAQGLVSEIILKV
jgi:PAS domain S-box-containing protein